MKRNYPWHPLPMNKKCVDGGGSKVPCSELPIYNSPKRIWKSGWSSFWNFESFSFDLRSRAKVHCTCMLIYSFCINHVSDLLQYARQKILLKKLYQISETEARKIFYIYMYIFDDKKHKKCMLKKKISIWIFPKMVKWQLFNNSFKKFFQKVIMKWNKICLTFGTRAYNHMRSGQDLKKTENKSKTHDLFKTTPGKKKYSFYT